MKRMNVVLKFIKNKTPLLTVLLIILGLSLLILALWQTREFTLLLLKISHKSDDLPSNSVDLEGIKTFIPISGYGNTKPTFNRDGTSIIFCNPNGELEINNLINIDSPNVVHHSLLPVITIVRNDNDTLAIVEWQPNIMTQSSLDLYDFHKNSSTTIVENAWGVSWTPDYKNITYIHFEDNQEGLWLSNKEGSNPKLISYLKEISFPKYIAWSSLGTRFIVQGATGIQVFSFQEEKAIELSWIPWAKDSSWSPDGWSLAFRITGEEADTLWIANFDGEEQRQVFEGVFSEFNWLPDGRLVFFTPAKEGGAACWALDPLTGTKELLADSSTVIYKPIGNIAVSPKGDALAFVAQDQQIWLLSLPSKPGY